MWPATCLATFCWSLSPSQKAPGRRSQSTRLSSSATGSATRRPRLALSKPASRCFQLLPALFLSRSSKPAPSTMSPAISRGAARPRQPAQNFCEGEYPSVVARDLTRTTPCNGLFHGRRSSRFIPWAAFFALAYACGTDVLWLLRAIPPRLVLAFVPVHPVDYFFNGRSPMPNGAVLRNRSVYGMSRLPTRSRSNRNLMLATLSGIGCPWQEASGIMPAMSAARIRCSSAMRLAPFPPGVFAPVTESPSTPVRKGGGNSDDGFLGPIPLAGVGGEMLQ